MRRLDTPSVMRYTAAPAICALIAALALSGAYAADEGGGGEAGAKIIEVSGRVEIAPPGQPARIAEPGDFVSTGEEMTVERGSTVTLAMADRTLREFTGPTTLTIQRDVGRDGTVLGNLTEAVADMLFTTGPRTSGAVMATRSAGADAEGRFSVPVLTSPAMGENLMEMPREFMWRGIAGVPLYRVLIYSIAGIIWQTTTSEDRVRWPARDCDFAPGNTYYWVVEALVGNTTLRSQACEFNLMAREDGAALNAALSEAGAAVADPDAALALKACICMDARAYSRALELLDRSIEEKPSRAAYLLRAEVNEAIGLYSNAVLDYREAMALPDTE